MCAQKKYYPNVNCMRGISILFVLIGHALADAFKINSTWSSSVAEFFFQTTYSFHMPLFFFISGFCNVRLYGPNTFQESGELVKHRFMRLMVPYFVWGILYVFFDIVGGNYTWDKFSILGYIKQLIEGDNANWQLWTLYTLFACSVLTVIISFLNIRIESLLGFTLVMFLARIVIRSIHGLPHFLFITIIEQTTKYMFFFLAGIFIRKNNLMDYNHFYSKKLFWITLFALFAVNFLAYGIEKALKIGSEYNIIEYCKILGAPIGIISVIAFSFICQKIKSVDCFFQKLGDNCMGIYIFSNLIQVCIRKISSFVFINRNIGVSLVQFGLSVICALVASIFIRKVLLRNRPLLKQILLGE